MNLKSHSRPLFKPQSQTSKMLLDSLQENMELMKIISLKLQYVKVIWTLTQLIIIIVKMGETSPQVYSSIYRITGQHEPQNTDGMELVSSMRKLMQK